MLDIINDVGQSKVSSSTPPADIKYRDLNWKCLKNSRIRSLNHFPYCLKKRNITKMKSGTYGLKKKHANQIINSFCHLLILVLPVNLQCPFVCFLNFSYSKQPHR